MADLLSNVAECAIFAMLGLIAVYVTFRVATIAVLKSINDWNDSRKAQLAKES